MKLDNTAVTIRRLVDTDIEEVAAIESRCFSDPWSASVIASTLSASGTFALAAQADDGAICGYLFASFLGGVFYKDGTPEPSTDETIWECELQNIAVSPLARRKGVASALLRALIDQCERIACDRIMLEVREQNTAARNLYRAFGFFEVGIRKNYYTNPKENAVLMDRISNTSDGKSENL